MAYRNAQEILPEGLLKQIQRYVSGETIYVPAREEKKAWGETSGYQQYIRERNWDIRAAFARGVLLIGLRIGSSGGGFCHRGRLRLGCRCGRLVALLAAEQPRRLEPRLGVLQLLLHGRIQSGIYPIAPGIKISLA